MKTRLLTTLSLTLCLTGSVPSMAQNTPQSQMEYLDRGVTAFRSGSANIVSWRFLGTDDEDNTRFDVKRNGTVVTQNAYKTWFKDNNAPKGATYEIVTKVNGEEVETSAPVTASELPYQKVQLDRPAKGANGGEYSPNDMSVGDVDGDGQYELFVKWDPNNSKDNSQGGITDNVFIDCYRLDGAKLWRIDLGRNIRAGAHYTQYMVYDFDGDGKAEMMCKTGPGSLDGTGQYVNQAATDNSIKSVSGTASYRSSDGRITGGQEWLTVFRGETGQAVHTIFYNPNRNMTYGGAADGSVNWGDVDGKNDKGSYGNRGERFLAAVAWLDGPDGRPSGIFSRGYYGYAFIWAVTFDGEQLHQKWLSSHKSKTSYSLTTYNAQGTGTTKSYSGLKATGSRSGGSATMFANGNHNMSVADVDGDGCDEIVWGSAALDHDGTLLYGTGFGHGDAIHLADHCPDRPGMEVFQIHEESPYGWDLHDARTGQVIWSATGGSDNGRGIAAAFDAYTRGSLFWSSNDGQPRRATSGAPAYSSGGSSNFRIFWDGDLQEELLDGSKLDKFNSGSGGTTRLFTIYDAGPGSTCNGSKNTPNLQADILGDWREEVILHDGSSVLAIYSSDIDTKYRVPTLMHDHTYRMGVAWQNTAYNQPPHLGYYLPDAMLPQLTGHTDITVAVGEEINVEIRSRYTSVIAQSGYFIDGVTARQTGMPDGIAKSLDYTNKSITFTGTPATAATYRFPVTLTGLGSEKVNDTITIRVTDLPSAVGTPQVSLGGAAPRYYDLQGRRHESARRGLFLLRRGDKVTKVVR